MKKCSTLILSMLLILQCFTLHAAAGENDPSLSLAVTTPGFTAATPIPFGDKITLTYTATNCEDYLGDGKNGSITVYNGSDVVAENLTSPTGTITVPSAYTTNTLTAKLFNGENEICVSEPLTFAGTALYHNATAPGVCRDFESGGGKWNTGSGSTLDASASLQYAYDDTHGKVAYAKWTTSHNNNRYESTNCLSANVMQGRFFEVSADIKINRPDNQSDNIALLNVWSGKDNPTDGTKVTGNDFNYITLYLLKNGELGCNNTNNKPGITPTLNEWHNYKIIGDSNPGGYTSLYYYLDDVLIYCLTRNDTYCKSILRVNITPSFTVTSGSADTGTEMWLDNVTLRTYDNALTGTLSIGGDTTLTATEFENITPEVTFNQPIDETTLSTMVLKKNSGGNVSFDGRYDAATRTYTMNSVSLEGNENYTLDLSSVAVSSAVQGYIGSESVTCAPVSFTTMNYGFTASLAENGEAVTETTEVPYENAKLAITFDSEMNLETLKNMTLTAGDNTSVTLNGTLSDDKKVYTLDALTLQPNTDYTLRFGGVTTLATGAKGCKPISFTTKKGPAIVLSIDTAGFNQNIPIPFGEKVQVNYAVDAAPWLNGDTGSVAIYNGETQVAEGLEAKNGVIRIASQSANHTVSAKLLDDAGNVLYESNSVTFKGVSLEKSATGAGFCWDFDTASGGKWNTPDGVTAVTTSLQYQDDDAHGNVAYAKWADTNANCRFESGKGIDEGTEGRFLEISADLKINRTNEGQKDYIGLFTTFYQTVGGSKTVPALSIAKDGTLLCTGQAISGITPDWTTWHNYKVIFDTNLNGSRTVYCFLDNTLIYCRTDADNQYTKILKANIAPSHNLTSGGSGVALEMWMDNLTIRSYEEQFNATLSVNASDLNETPYEAIAPTIAFTQAMDATTLNNIKLQDENGNDITLGEGTYSETQQTYTLPQLTLLPNTKYTISLDGVKTAKQAGGIITKLQFKTKKAPFSVRSVEEKDGQLAVIMNNEGDKTQNAILIFGYFDAEKMVGGITENVSAVKNGDTLTYTPKGTITATTMEAYLVEIGTFKLLDECIVSIK